MEAWKQALEEKRIPGGIIGFVFLDRVTHLDLKENPWRDGCVFLTIVAGEKIKNVELGEKVKKGKEKRKKIT